MTHLATLPCAFCKGTGKDKGIECYSCKGTGSLVAFLSLEGQPVVCAACHGTGIDGKRECGSCKGGGVAGRLDLLLEIIKPPRVVK